MKRTRSKSTGATLKRRRVNFRKKYDDTPQDRFKNRVNHPMPWIAPSHQFAKLKYVETNATKLNLVGGSGVYAISKFWNANDVVNTNGTGASTNGIIPGIFEWATLYQNFKIYGCKAKVQIQNLDTGNSIIAGIIFNPANTTLTTWSNFRTCSGNMYGQQEMMGALSSTDSVRTFKRYVRFRDMAGDKNQFDADVSYQGQLPLSTLSIAGTAPTIIFYMQVFILSNTGSGPSLQTVPAEMALDFTWYIDFVNRRVDTT